MLTQEMVVTIQVLKKRGQSIKAISRETSLCQDSCHPLNLNQESGKDTIYGPLFTRA